MNHRRTVNRRGEEEKPLLVLLLNLSLSLSSLRMEIYDDGILVKMDKGPEGQRTLKEKEKGGTPSLPPFLPSEKMTDDALSTVDSTRKRRREGTVRTRYFSLSLHDKFLYEFTRKRRKETGIWLWEGKGYCIPTIHLLNRPILHSTVSLSLPPSLDEVEGWDNYSITLPPFVPSLSSVSGFSPLSLNLINLQC